MVDPVTALLEPLAPWLPLVVMVLLAAVVALIVVSILATRRARRAVTDRADRERRTLELEVALTEQTGRLRIIREVHEVAAHALTGIVSSAEGAALAAARDAEVAARTAGQIASTARATLADLRRVMGVAAEAEAVASTRPPLSAIHDLFAVMRDSGLVVTFSELGEPFALKEGTELAVYRILEEALANALTHGGEGTEVRVGFTWSAEGLHVRADDDGIRAQARREGLSPEELAERGYTIEDDLAALTQQITGSGLSEVRSRAELYGGIVTATTVPGVGFSLSVVFPALRFHNGVHGVDLGRA